MLYFLQSLKISIFVKHLTFQLTEKVYHLPRGISPQLILAIPSILVNAIENLARIGQIMIEKREISSYQYYMLRK